jgi:hypothetical protein
MAPEQPDYDGEYSHHDSLEQWEQWDSVCRYCFRTISSSRPPVFNPDNCGCAEAGTFASGGAENSQSTPYELQGVQHGREVYCQRPQSTTSSEESVSCPEGPEREEPKLHVSNTFLPLVADAGLNEAQHRRSASFHSEMSYQMRQFLEGEDPRLSLHSNGTPSIKATFLPQDIHIQAQRAKKSKNRSKPSYQSFSSGSGEVSFHSWGGDPTIAVGTQFDVGRSVFEGEYPLTISGMSGYRSEE